MLSIEQREMQRSLLVVQVKKTVVQIKRLSLSSLKSVRAFAEDVIKSKIHVDVLINNAGVMINNIFSKPEDDFETTFK